MIDSSPQAFRAEEMNTIKVRYIHSPKNKKKGMMRSRDFKVVLQVYSRYFIFETSNTTAIFKASDPNLPLETQHSSDILASSL